MKKHDVAKHIFARNPKLNEVHVTSDGVAFHTEHQAHNHAVRLKDQKIASFKREDVLPAKEATVSPDQDDENKDLDKVQAAAERVQYAKNIGVETDGIETSEELEKAIAEAEAAKEEAKNIDVDTTDVDVSFLSKNVGPCQEEIAKVESLEALDAIEKAEIAGEDRKGVKAAIADRRAELEKEV